MKSINLIANAINNLATAINKLADSNKVSTLQPLSKTTTSNPYSGSVNVTKYTTKDSEGWFSLSAAEKEQLYYIYKAIMEKGINPNYHDTIYDKLMDNLNKNWPSLHKPIQKLVAIKEKSVLDKNIYTNHSKVQIWKNK
jgi:hypothetical protein